MAIPEVPRGSRITILGASGFIGSHLVKFFEQFDLEVLSPGRGRLPGGSLGAVIYAIGAVGDFRDKPYASVDANLCVLMEVLKRQDFDSLTYLSSSRVYAGHPGGARIPESATLVAVPDSDGIYNLSKLTAEALVLSHPNEHCRALRLSNVYGRGMSEHTFLGSITRDLKCKGYARIDEAPSSGRDYVSIADVVKVIAATLSSGKHRLYNVGSGTLVTHAELADQLTLLGYTLEFSGSGPKRTLPLCDIDRLRAEFGFRPRVLLDELKELI